MASNLDQFDAHGALPEDLAHEIFEQVRSVMMDFAGFNEDVHQAVNNASREIQIAVANHMAAIQWKMLNRRKLSRD